MAMDYRSDSIARITAKPEQYGGRPCIRGMRIRVTDILKMLAEDMTADEILVDFPDLERADIQACLLFAAHQTNSGFQRTAA